MRSRASGIAVVGVVGALALAACGASPAGTGPAEPKPVGKLPAAAQQIMSKPAYKGARWLYLVSDLKTGKVLFSSHPDELAFTGSTAKLFTIGTLLDTSGADATLTTPVYAHGDISNGVLTGQLDLVGSGDLTLGGREAAQGKAVDAFTATTIDHVYADNAPNGAIPAGDPLAGLDSLAKQVAASGIHHVAGDVVVDDRLWNSYTGQEGPVPPIFVNDNLLDITVTPGAAGATATLATAPQTGAYQVVSDVSTVAGSDSSLSVEADAQNPRLLHVSGKIGASAGPRLTIYRIPDAATWARTLFVEALARAGVTVTAAANAGNDAGLLPPKGSYLPGERVAAYTSPPLSTLAAFVMRTSYNTGANSFLCQIAVHAGSADCPDGLTTIRALTIKAQLDPNQLILVDGQGADPASVNPSTLVAWLRYVNAQPWGPALTSGLPILGVDGTLAASGIDSPARGKIAAKTGTSAHVDPATGRALFNVQAMGGFMKADDGRVLVFDVLVSGAMFPDPVTGITQVGDDVAGVSAAFQQAAK
jgi:D-alanyl-D-alanine carboxypeptidase/D-alanyl-D-alanine-endopeptidase (penicillin-binding protein 4)